MLKYLLVCLAATYVFVVLQSVPVWWRVAKKLRDAGFFEKYILDDDDNLHVNKDFLTFVAFLTLLCSYCVYPAFSDAFVRLASFSLLSSYRVSEEEVAELVREYMDRRGGKE